MSDKTLFFDIPVQAYLATQSFPTTVGYPTVQTVAYKYKVLLYLRGTGFARLDPVPGRRDRTLLFFVLVPLGLANYLYATGHSYHAGLPPAPFPDFTSLPTSHCPPWYPSKQ
jgi:hypothetical protein